ncbi:type VI secretion system tip protein VgrG [Photorhabdus laumondii subsp. laumondii]|nr:MULTISPECIES: type VI secretion system tip protein TssI/VgrG [Photorhabdus]AXG42087.1 type VI secretion system tip protein VgrG [Photorhabdus laumondii subsp. laumondii]AXG46677.1 type VI secretion system tip protein VgrG [Photorhabdus laumondii subsp. laumondii]MCC8386062.1 type VI secretion system tip protein VgrG [Photorhabdus laumondii]MCC8390406.1 type VI secretion system tip protein VgrG [Photorhabdus laumondii]MCC8415093.1 type VI secretion system tip protein VgrG [Photorhabdus laumo
MDGLVFTCRIGVLPQTTFQVAQFTLQEELSQLYRLTLKVVSSRDDIPLNEQLGDSASLTITRNGVTERTINGMITGAEQGNTDGRSTFYIFTVRPKMWLMTLNQDSRIFHRKSVPEILTILLKEHYIFFARDTLYKRHVEREYTTQKRESAYDFWCRLAAEEGIIFWFEEEQTLFCDCRLGMQADIDLTYNTHPETDETDTTAYQWSYGEYLCSNGTIQKDHNFLNPKYSLEHQKQSDDSGHHSVFESYGRFQWDEEGKPFTQLRLEQLRNYSKVGTAKTNCIRLRPGKIFTLQSHPIEAMNARWQVISVTHHGWQPVASNDGGEGTTLTNEVAFIPGNQDWRPPYRYKPLADGDEVATVVGVGSEEIYVNEHGAIRIHFHWNRYDKADDNASCWVRVAQGWNGNGFGFMAIPRVGQEVIVSYLNGDIDRPIVTGCTYNGLNRPPLDLPREKTRTTFKTRTLGGQGFNELRFEDNKGREEVFIHAQRDMNSQILRDKTTQIGHDQQTEVAHNRTAIIKNDDDEAVQGGQTLEVGQNQTVTIKGQQAISIGKSHQLNVADNQQITVGKHITVHSESGQIIIGNAGGQIVIDPMGNIRIEGVSITMTDHITGKKSAGALFDYSARYTLLSEQSGKPLAHTRYTITTAGGQTLSGKTDAQGRTVTVQSEAEENLQLSSPEASPKPKKTLCEVGDNTPVEYVMEFMEE